jgi:hypothetical protein
MLVTDPNSDAELIGHLFPTEEQASFVVPVFRIRNRNEAIVQTIGEDGMVTGFATLSATTYLRRHSGVDMRVGPGGRSLWAFRKDDGTVLTGSRDELAAILPVAIAETDDPFLQLQVALFCGLERQFSKRWRNAFNYMNTMAPRSATAWRDVVIVPPAIRAAVQQVALLHGLGIHVPDLVRDVSTIVSGERIEIGLEDRLHAAIASDETALRTLRGATLPLRRAFGLKPDVIVQRSQARPPEEKRRSADWPCVVALGDLPSRVLVQAQLIGQSASSWISRIGPANGASAFVATLIEGKLHIGTNAATPEPIFEPGQALALIVEIEKGSGLLELAIELAIAHRSADRHVIAIVPRLPAPAANDEHLAAWSKLIDAVDELWIITDQTPHLRQNPALGPGRSIPAVARRLSDLFALIGASGLKIDQEHARTAGTKVSVMSSAVGRATAARLLDQTLLRISAPTLNLGSAYTAIVSVDWEQRPDTRERVAAAVLDVAPSADLMPGSSVETSGQDTASICLRGVTIRALSRDEYEERCLDLLAKGGWRIDRRRGRYIIVENGGSEWRLTFHYGPQAWFPDVDHSIAVPHPELRIVDAMVGRREFLAGVLSGAIPIHVGRLAVAANIVRNRWRTAVTIVRDRTMNADDLLTAAARDLVLDIRHGGSSRRGSAAHEGILIVDRPLIGRHTGAVTISLSYTFGSVTQHHARVVMTPGGLDLA